VSGERADVEAAVRTIIRWTGDDPERDGLAETPARVARAFEEFFVGYAQDGRNPAKRRSRNRGYDERSCCGASGSKAIASIMAPILGRLGYVSSRGWH
jgi:GTP cyclohydrolase I